MFIVRAKDDNSIDYYHDLDQVYQNCEGIDVRDGLYEFTDSEGNTYDVEWVEAVERTKWFGLFETVSQGKYRLVKRD